MEPIDDNVPFQNLEWAGEPGSADNPIVKLPWTTPAMTLLSGKESKGKEAFSVSEQATDSTITQASKGPS